MSRTEQLLEGILAELRILNERMGNVETINRQRIEEADKSLSMFMTNIAGMFGGVNNGN